MSLVCSRGPQASATCSPSTGAGVFACISPWNFPLASYDARHLDRVIAAINGTGYELTFRVHSRIDHTVTRLTAGVRTGNRYGKRNLIGAVVGYQPFGGEGLSGTGPKAGGPAYLQRFTTERVLPINTATKGGDLDLLSRSD